MENAAIDLVTIAEQVEEGSKGETMSPDENKALYRRLLDAMNRKDLTAAEAWMAPDAVNHTPAPGEPPGRAGFRYRMGMMLTAFPDVQFTIADQIAEGDKVATRGTLRGTHTGPFAGIPPTGRPVQVDYIDILRVADGQFVGHWVQMDQVGMMQQLGVMPTAGQGGA